MCRGSLWVSDHSCPEIWNEELDASWALRAEVFPKWAVLDTRAMATGETVTQSKLVVNRVRERKAAASEMQQVYPRKATFSGGGHSRTSLSQGMVLPSSPRTLCHSWLYCLTGKLGGS